MTRLKRKIKGNAERPRLSVSKSLKNVFAQIIDDDLGNTIVGMSTMKLGVGRGNIETASKLGESIAKLAISKGIKKVVFDRGSNIYHGRIKALAEAARKGGLEF